MARELKPGMVVMVWNSTPSGKPIEEGKARLVARAEGEIIDGKEPWYVEFLEEPGERFVRWIPVVPGWSKMKGGE